MQDWRGIVSETMVAFRQRRMRGFRQPSPFRSLPRRLLPLAYGLAIVIVFIMLLTWSALHVQITLAGLLNAESIWSKAQKQAVIDLLAYAGDGKPGQWASFRQHIEMLQADMWVRDAVASGHYDQRRVDEGFRRGEVISSAQSSMVFAFRYFRNAPYMRQAMAAWHASDPMIAELIATGDELQRDWAAGRPTAQEVARQRERIRAINARIQPLSDRFSLEIAKGAESAGRTLFVAVVLAAVAAMLVLLYIAHRILAAIRASEGERQIVAEALANVAEGVIVADAERRVVATNTAHARITGYATNALLGKPFDTLRTLPDGSPLPASVWSELSTRGHWRGEVRARRFDGSTYAEQISISAIRDAEGRIQRHVVVVSDISKSKAVRDRLEYLATHDPLTGLLNRAEFERHVARAIDEAKRERKAMAVLFIDMDAFKAVNDSFSHATGDRMLGEIARRIVRELREDDVTARLGGDEFTVLVRRLAAREDVTPLAERLLASLLRPLHVDGHEVVLGASIGIAGHPLDGDDPATLLANADAAMYAAKSEAGNAYRFYAPYMQSEARDRLRLGHELRRALAGDEFRLVYQPTVEMRSGRVMAVEALVRWMHPDRGELAPDQFIPVAEKLGLMRMLDTWVLNAVCEQIRVWNGKRMPPLRVAVNASASSFSHPGYIDTVRKALQDSGIPADRLMFEITEGTILRMGESTDATMRALHELGIEVAIDDFGTGYSSLSYLKLPAITCLKIDRSFVSGLPNDANNAAITEAILALSRSLGLRTIAEGIETDAQHDFLLRLGCAEAQGYLYSYPLSVTDLERLLMPNAPHTQTHLRLVKPPQ